MDAAIQLFPFAERTSRHNHPRFVAKERARSIRPSCSSCAADRLPGTARLRQEP